MFNKKLFSKKKLNSWGLLFNLYGSILIFLSIGINPNTYYKTETGQKFYDAIFYFPWAGKVGIGLLILGFILMVIANERKEDY